MVARDGNGAGHPVTNGSTENSTAGHKPVSNATTAGGKKFKFPVTAIELGELSTDSNRLALADLLEKAVKKIGNESVDIEAPSSDATVDANILALVKRMRELEANVSPDENSPEVHEANKCAEVAANTLVTVLLGSSSETGVSPDELGYRREVFGSNEMAERKLDSFLKLCWEAVQDFVLIMLIFLGVIGIVVETTIGLKPGETCGTCWIEGTAILVSVVIVVCVTAGIDYAKQFAFIRLTKSLNETNTKSVIRNGVQVSVTDTEIVVGDILSVNSHNLASIPADCVLLGPPSDLKMDESSLTGESKPVTKRPGDVVLSGTTASQGSGKMIVIAVGLNSVSGKIKARVYASHELDDDLAGEDDNSPLFVKLDLIAKQIGIVGTTCATLAFIASCVIGLGIKDEPPASVINYLIVAITVLAVAVPEGLPLAVTLALAFSSSKMMQDMNLVKHLDACETMGCATTICTDKTGM